ncbi:unnamed protein product [Eretmochelys imbricata]
MKAYAQINLLGSKVPQGLLLVFTQQGPSILHAALHGRHLEATERLMFAKREREEPPRVQRSLTHCLDFLVSEGERGGRCVRAVSDQNPGRAWSRSLCSRLAHSPRRTSPAWLCPAAASPGGAASRAFARWALGTCALLELILRCPDRRLLLLFLLSPPPLSFSPLCEGLSRAAPRCLPRCGTPLPPAEPRRPPACVIVSLRPGAPARGSARLRRTGRAGAGAAFGSAGPAAASKAAAPQRRCGGPDGAGGAPPEVPEVPGGDIHQCYRSLEHPTLQRLQHSSSVFLLGGPA